MTETPEQSLRVFISYSRKDLEIAEALREGLVNRNIEAFLDVHDIELGEDWKNRLRGLIASAEKVALLVSPDSVASDICAWEVDEAERQAKPVFPVLVRDTNSDEIPGRISRLNFTFYRTEEERAANVDRLAEALKTDLLWEREKTKLNDQAEAWQTAGRPRRLLITRDDAIRHAETWRDGAPENAQPPTEVQRDFIRESRVHLGRRQRRSRIGLGTVAVAITTVSAFAITQHQVAAANLRSVEDAEAVTAFTDDSFANLNPKFRGKDILLIEVIDAVDERLAEGGVQLRPTAEASLRDSIGWTYFQLGAYKEADPHLTLASQIRRKSVGYESPQFALSYYKQTLNDWYLGRTAGLTEKLEEIIDLQRRVLGAKSILLAITLKDLSWKYVLDQRYGPAEELAESAIAVFQEAGAVDPPSREYIEMVNNYGVLKQAVAEQARLDGDLQTARANFSEAETYLRNAIDMHIGTFGEDSAGLGSSYNNLANLYSSLWRNDEAIDLHRKNVDLASRVLGDDHYSTILGRSNLAGVLNIECRYKEAKEMYESALPGWDAVGGEDQPFALDTQEGIINVYFQLGDHRKAATELENLYEIRRRVNGDAADETLNTLDFLVAAQSWADNHQRSVDLINQHYERLFDMHGGADLATSRARWIWADYYFAQTEYETVRDAIEEQIKHLSKAESDSDNKWAEAIDEWRIFLARVDIRERKYEDAAARLEAVLEHNDDRYGKYNERSLDAIGWLALTRWRLGEKDASIATWQDRLDRVREKWGNNAPDVWSNRERLSRLYLRTGQVERGRETFAPFLERDSHPCDPEGLRETQLDLVSKLFDEGDYEASARVAQHAFRQEDNDVGVPTQTALDALDWAVKSLIEQGSWDKADNLARTWRDRLERRSELEGTPMPESADVALQTIAERRL